MARSDAGTPRAKYSLKVDNTGKVGRENATLRSFWSKYKMVDIIQLTPEEIDKKIEEWLIEFEATSLKRDRYWNYPHISYEPIKKPKAPRKVNTSFNSSFVRKKMI